MTFSLFWHLCVVFGAVFVVGAASCLPLYHGDFQRFFASRLWLKTYRWIPLFAQLCLVAWLGFWAALAAFGVLVIQGYKEFRRSKGVSRQVALGYFGLFVLGMTFLLRIMTLQPAGRAVIVLCSICFASAVSDAGAFFAGSYWGKHHLPANINAAKSWEGVAGQIIGSFGGLGLVALLPEINFSWRLALGVGLASAAGDLLNSTAKRALRIKDWGETIPGHGGILDRFASLSAALAVGYLIVTIH